MKNIDEIKNAFQEMDTRLAQAEKEVKEVAKFRSRLKEISKNMTALQDFYQSEDWLEDRITLHENLKGDEYYYSASEDSIWNVTQDFYLEKIKLLKQLVKEL